jgi:O-methyltransferase
MNKLFTFVRLVCRRDPLLRFIILRLVARCLVPSYRFHWPHLSWWNDELFTAYLKKFDQLRDSNSHRHWMLKQLMKQVSNLSGNTAECGVFKGASSYLICEANQANGGRRLHHMFDSFAGLSNPSEVDGDHWSAGDLACSLESVRNNLCEFNDAVMVFHVGFIPKRFYEVSEEQFSFVHIDVDLYQPTMDSLIFFYPRMQPGGIILLDDYGFTTCPGAIAACDEYMQGKPEPIIGLPTGGGFLIKQ